MEIDVEEKIERETTVKTQTIDVITKLKKDDYLKLALFNYINPKSIDMIVHSVGVLEDLMAPKLKNNEEYQKELKEVPKKVMEILKEKYGNPKFYSDELRTMRILLEARLRFRLLWDEISKRIPEEVVGEI